MFTELSRDGTRIACDIQGSGPAVILIDGALPYAIEKEVEDIESLIDNAGGWAFLYGHR